jgi:hypothetical protein
MKFIKNKIRLFPVSAILNAYVTGDTFSTCSYIYRMCMSKSKLLTTVSLSRCPAHPGSYDQILLPARRLLSESCGLVSVGRPL